MTETRRFKLTKRVSFSLAWCWEYDKKYVRVFNLIPLIGFLYFGSVFKEWRDIFPRCAIQFSWLYILFRINIFITDKTKTK